MKKYLFSLFFVILAVFQVSGQCPVETNYIQDLSKSKELREFTSINPKGQDAWYILHSTTTVASQRVQASELNYLLDYLKKTKPETVDEIESLVAEINKKGGYNSWKNSLADVMVNNIDDFVKLSKAKKLSYIEDAWKAYYPQIFFERKLFEDMMSSYRYSKSLWSNTDEIATNFKAIDFYKKGTSSGNNIFTETAVSMKTTTVTDVNKWLESNAIKNNLDNLIVGKGANNGITWNGKTIIYNKAEVHIYMPKEKFTDAIKNEWLSTLKIERPTIDFKINTLEEFIP